MQHPSLTAYGDFLRDLADYSKWLVATSALTLGICSPLLRAAQGWFSKVLFTGAALSSMASIYFAVIGVLEALADAAIFRDPASVGRPEAYLATKAVSVSGPLNHQCLSFVIATAFLISFLLAVLFESKHEEESPFVVVCGRRLHKSSRIVRRDRIRR